MLDTSALPTIDIEPVTVEPERNTRMLPGEAIRLGRLRVPLKSSGSLIVRHADGRILAACALGAMAIGYGDEGATGAYYWPEGMPDFTVNRPCCGYGPDNIKAVTAHINDAHIATEKPSWTEQRLADWLDREVTAAVAKAG